MLGEEMKMTGEREKTNFVTPISVFPFVSYKRSHTHTQN